MKVWCYEHCYCKYETGYAVMSIHESEALAKRAMRKAVNSDNHYGDGDRVVEWEVEEADEENYK